MVSTGARGYRIEMDAEEPDRLLVCVVRFPVEVQNVEPVLLVDFSPGMRVPYPLGHRVIEGKVA